MKNETALQLRVAQLRLAQRDELIEAMSGVCSALQHLECADLWADLPVEYRKLACQLRVLSHAGISPLEDSRTDLEVTVEELNLELNPEPEAV